jgi:hypothetical protein
MDIKKFTEELIDEWRKLPENQRGLAGIVDNKESGLKGEKSALSKLRNELSDYEFTLTPNSWSPADIIGFKKDSDFWHFALYQVKTSINEQSLTSEISEKNTLPLLAKLLKRIYPNSDQTKYYKNKPIYITLGYLGLHNKNGRNTIVKRVPYQKDFTMNGLNLTSSQKTEIRNLAHR